MNRIKFLHKTGIVTGLGLMMLTSMSLPGAAQTDSISCSVSGVERGQLALRATPNGESVAGLVNGNTVSGAIEPGRRITQDGVIWLSVQVVQGPNSQVNGKKGWVNANYLDCSSPRQTYCLVTGLETGQLALRKSANGEAIGGLDNDNLVRFLQEENSWFKVLVIEGPNPEIAGREGWVNSQYLECAWD